MKERADILVVQQGLASTRTRAQALLLAGRIYWGERRIDKPGVQLPPDARLELRGEERYVSRGGHKLEGALATLQVGVADWICLDVGASTGGFTDCLLQHGAKRVYAVDVGRAQLATALRENPRVVVREQTNARHLRRADFEEAIDLVVVDASFIGIEKLLPAISTLLDSGKQLLCLIKPQFQAGRDEARKARGVIRDAKLREAVIDEARSAIHAAGFDIRGDCTSALPGPKGNVEHFTWAIRR
jgi:23S rRNA (cytidine1920-2'-O)/16S rRNA (cytidine1409-2'-O)-methyltransferase